MMPKILIIGDSSSLSREELSFNKTYYAIMKNKKNYILEMNATANNTSRNIAIKLESFLLYGYSPDVVILNYGIVDVYPRPYPNKIHKLLSCVGLLQYIDTFLKKTKLYYKFGDFFNFKEVSLDEFRKYSENIVVKLLKKEVKQIIIIGIIKPYKVLLKSKKVKEDIELYNASFKKLAEDNEEISYIDIYNDSSEDFTIWDGYHYSEQASKYLTMKIEKIIKYD